MSTIALAAGQVDKCIRVALQEASAQGSRREAHPVEDDAEPQHAHPASQFHISKEAKLALHKAATMTVLMLSTLAEEERVSGGPTKKGNKSKAKKVTRTTLTADDVSAGAVAGGIEDLLLSLQTDNIDSAKKRRTE